MKHSRPRSRSWRRGLSSMVVIGFLVVLFILFSHMVLLMRQEAYMASHFHKRGILANIADAGAACALNAIDLMLADPESELFKKLADPGTVKAEQIAGVDLPVIPIYPDGKYKLKSLDEILAAFQPLSITLEVKAQIRYLRRFENPYKAVSAPAFRPHDPSKYGISEEDFDNECTAKEKIGLLEVVSTARLSPMQQIVREQREIKVTCNALPVVSRFNLFLQNSFSGSDIVNYPDASGFFFHGAYSGMDMKKVTTTWNRVEVKESGGASKGKILNLCNGNTPGTKGWIFLGGGKKPDVGIVHALAGGKSQTGDGHFLQPDLFLNDGSLGYGPGDFPGNIQPNPPSGVTHEHPVASSGTAGTAGGSGGASSGDNAGWFQSGHCTDLKQFNDNHRLFLDIWLKTNAHDRSDGTAYCSLARLFGPAVATGLDAVDASHEYVIMGNVWQSFTQIGAFQFRSGGSSGGSGGGGGWALTGFFPYMPSPDLMKQIITSARDNIWRAAEQLSPAQGGTGELSYDSQIVAFGSNIGRALLALMDMQIIGQIFDETAGDRELAKIDMNIWQMYEEFMSQPRFEPYFWSSGSLARFHGEFICRNQPSARGAMPCRANEWASLLPEKTHPAVMQTEREFKKSLNGFYLPPKYFEDRCTFHFRGDDGVKEFHEYLKEHIEGGTLKLGKFLLVEGSIQLPALSRVEQGGVICAVGNIDVSRIGHGPDDGEKELGQGLLTLVSLGGTIRVGGEVQASLVCLGGPNGPEGKGKIELTSELKLFGNLVGEFADPANLVQHGGTLTYNKALSPEHKMNNPSSYRVNDYAYVSNLMPRIFRWEVKAE